MAHVLFIQTEWFEHLGILSLAAAARADGHRVSLIVSRNARKTAARAVDLAPSVIALSATTGAHRFALAMARELRPFFPGRIILGGPHPTFFPEVISEPSLDAICRGEGETPLVELLSRLDSGRDLDDLPGFWIKDHGKIWENPPAELIPDLDALPFPARDLLDRYPIFAKGSMGRVMTGRGCPYRCTYCFNEAMRELIRGRGQYVRLRTVDHVIAELKTIAAAGRKTINFVDDTFGLKREWALDFLERYAREIALPFIVNLRPDQVDPELTKALRTAGCYCAQMGVESARPELRGSVLGREVSDEALREAARQVKAAGLRLLTYNMVALPGETLADAAATLEWNGEMKVDFPRVSIFQPYPRTVLGDKVLAGLGPENISNQHSGPDIPVGSPLRDKNVAPTSNFHLDLLGESYFRHSPLSGPEIRRIENLHKLFLPYLRWPASRKAILALTRLPANPLFDLVFLAAIGLQYRKATNRSLPETIALGLRNLHAYYS